MTDKPILFSDPMSRALLEGRKTQTRRIIKTPGPEWVLDPTRDAAAREGYFWFTDDLEEQPGCFLVKSKYRPGDRLWVREAYYQRGHWEPVPGRQTKGGRQKWAFKPADNVICFDVPDGESVRLGRRLADPSTVAWHKRLGRFMPRWASRLTLIVTDVRVERLRDINRGDAMDEGCPFPNMSAGPDPRHWYSELWDQINGPGAWDANPWVAAYTFSVINGNIDEVRS